MLRAYTYTPQEAGQPSGWGAGGFLRLEGVEDVTDPEAADLFVFPDALHRWKDPRPIRALPYMKGHEEQHLFFDISDEKHVYGLSSIFFRSSLTLEMRRTDPNSLAWPWPVDDLASQVPAPAEGWKYAVSFHGWINYEPRRYSIASVERTFGAAFDRRLYTEFYGHVYQKRPADARERRALFLESLRLSKVVLAPRSVVANYPYRFIEALSAGRIPALVCDGCVLPWEGDIDWAKCALLLSESEAAEAGPIIRRFLEKTTEEEYLERARYGRAMWERYLAPARWPALMREAAEMKLRAIGVLRP